MLINDDYSLAKDTLIVDLLTNTSVNFGFSYLCIGEKMKELPSVCKAFIELRDKKGVVIENNVVGNDEFKNTLDFDNSALKAKNQNSLYFNNNNTYRNKSSMMNKAPSLFMETSALEMQ